MNIRFWPLLVLLLLTYTTLPAQSAATGITFIQPPEASQQGSAQLNFPLNLPPGRQGVMPELTITYDSEGGNGWLGEGWSLATPAITVDTRWGAARYSAAQETESYLYEGQALYPLAHRGELRDRTSEQRFHPRIERAFERIIRHGDAPDNYWWEVTAIDGVRYYYGGTPAEGLRPEACLSDGQGNLNHWALVEIRDQSENFVAYHYAKVVDNGLPGSTEHGEQLYPDYLTYTGHGRTEGPFRVDFIRDRELNEDRRPDVSINLRTGAKIVTADLLRRVEISLNQALIRSYRLAYTTGAFQQSLLASITEENAGGIDFYSHTFDYYDDIRDGNAYRPFGATQNWTIPDDNIEGNIVNPIPGMNAETSALGGAKSSNFSAGAAATVGFNDFNLVSKDKTAGGTYAYGSSSDEGLIALVDINGDALPDKVYRRGNNLRYRPNEGLAGTTNYRFGSERPIHGIDQFSASRSSSNSYGFEGNPPGGFVGYEYTDATNTTNTYFTDFNGDGLLDIAKEGRVYFNHLDENGDPSFTTNSGDTPSPIQVGADLSGDLIEIDPDEIESLIDENPLHDMVRMWRAPYSGTIQVEAPVRLLPGPEPAASNYGLQDGVIVSIQWEFSQLWQQEIGPDDFNTYSPDLAEIAVQQGDHLYFRVQSIFDGAYDQVEWSPTITYTSIPPERVDADSIPLSRYQAAEDYLLSSEQQVGLPFAGDLQLAGTFSKARTSDDVQVTILMLADEFLNSRILFDTIFAADSIVQAPIEFPFAGLADDDLYCLVRSQTQIDWRTLQWTPNLYYTASPGQTVTDNEGEPLFNFCPAVKYRMYNRIWRDSEPWITPSTGTYTFSPDLDIDNGDEGRPGSVTFSIKRGGRSLYQENIQTENYGDFREEVQLDLQAGDTLYVGYFLSDWHSGNQVSEADFLVSPPGSDQDDRYAAGYYSAISEDNEVFGHLYRGWGQFIYNGNRERANGPIIQSTLTIDDELENIPEDIPEDPDDLDGFYNPTDAIFLIALAEAKTACWLGYDELTYLTGTVMSSSRLGDDNILPVLGGSGGSGLGAPNRISKINEHSVAGGIGVSVATGTASRTWTNTKVTLDVLDFNGDRYPDVISNTRIQYSTNRGGLQDGSIAHGFAGHHLAESTATGFTLGGSFVPSRTSNSGEAKGGSSNRRSAKAKRQSSKLGKTSRNAGNTAGDAIGISGTFSTDGDEATESWLDINGDGLIDKVFSDGRAALNYGYRFGRAEDWGFTAIQAGESLDYGGGFGINLFNGSIAGGLSLTRTDNRVTQALEDVNGDGLPDMVTVGSPVKVRLNTGTGFGPTIDWLGIEELDAGSATGESVNGAFTVCIPIVFIGIKICFNPSTSVGQGVSRQLQQLGDIDGDAYPDFLSSSHDGDLQVKPSTIGRTNKLRQINGPLGGGFTLDYAPTGTTYDLPYAIWTLGEVIVDAGPHQTGAHLRFRYADGRHDRHERAFYGFAEVTTQECDPASPEVVLRQRREHYATDHFYAQGLLLRESVLNAEGEVLQQQAYGYRFRDPDSGRELLAVELRSDNGRAFPVLLSREDQWFYGQSNPALTHRMTYDYDNYGNLTTFTDYGSGTEAERVQAEHSYHYREEAYHFDQWATVRISDANTILAERQAILNEAGSLDYLLEWVGPGAQARYDFRYDAYGNLLELQRPANANGERMTYQYTYDSLLHTYLVQETDAYGYERQQTLDPRYGELLWQSDENGQRTDYSLDEFGRPASVLLPLDRQDGSDYSIRYTYHLGDASYLQTARYDPAQEEAFHSYELIDAWGATLQRQETAEVISNPSQSPQLGLLVTGTYASDALQRATGEYRSFLVGREQGGRYQAPTTLATRFTYDLLDRPSSLSLEDGVDYTIDYTATRSSAGPVGHQWTITDPLGRIQQVVSDVWGKRLSISEQGAAGFVTTNFTYDGRGRLVATTGPTGATIKQTYDGLGHRITLDHPDAGLTEWRYDAAGNMIEKITPLVRAAAVEDAAIRYTYEYERLLGIDYPFRPQNQVRYHYGDTEADSNRVGRVWLVEDASGAQEFWYDAAGNIAKEVRSMLLNEVRIPTFVTSYQFDSWGRLQTLIYPDGEELSYRFNRGGQINGMLGEKAGRRYAYLEDCFYDTQGRRRVLEYGNGVRTQWQASTDGRRLSDLQIELPQQGRVVDQHFTYDAVGNLRTQQEQLATNAAGIRALSHDYTYDEQYRLQAATGSWQRPDADYQYTLDLELDSDHKLLEQAFTLIQNWPEGSDTVAQARQYAYTGAQAHFPTQLGAQSRLANAAGFVQQDSEEEDFRLYLWDEEGRLEALSQNAYLSRYTYDAEGRRAIRSHGPTQGIALDATPIGVVNHGRRDFTLYVNPFMTVVQDSFVKHYYLEDERLLSKRGTGFFGSPLLPPGEQITAGNLNLAERLRQLRQLMVDYIETAVVPPGHPSLPGYHVELESGNWPTLPERGLRFRPPPGWPQPQGRPDPSGPPGHPVWYEAPTDPGNAEPGYGYFDPLGREELDQYYFHSDPLGHVQQVTDAFGKLRQQNAFTPYGRPLVQEALQDNKIALPGYLARQVDAESGLHYLGDSYYSPADLHYLDFTPATEAVPYASPYLSLATQAYIGTDRQLVLDFVNNTALPNTGAGASWQNIGSGEAISATGTFNLSGASGAPPVDVPAAEAPDKKKRKATQSTDEDTANEAGEKGSGSTKTAGLIRNKPLLALRELFQRSKTTDKGEAAQEAAPEEVGSAQRQANRKFTIRPGDWDGIQVPGNRNFTFNPDGTTSSGAKRRRRSNGFKVRFRLDRM